VVFLTCATTGRQADRDKTDTTIFLLTIIFDFLRICQQKEPKVRCPKDRYKPQDSDFLKGATGALSEGQLPTRREQPGIQRAKNIEK
jgi:hypothetical protein